VAEHEAAAEKVVRVWDLPTRITHWSIVLLAPVSWWTATHDQLRWHRLGGYVLLGLLTFRLIWGLVGSETARFASFVRGPRAVLAYVAGRARPAAGHNPLGALSVAAMLLALCLQVGLGLFAVDEDGLDPSPLAKFVSFETGRAVARLHHLNFYVILGLAGLHVAAIGGYALRRRNLVGAMFTGRRRLPQSVEPPRFASPWIALAAAAVAAAVAWFLAHGAAF